VNGRYSHAETAKDRIAIAVLAGTDEYFRQFPDGVTPGATFLADWLEPFLELEELNVRMDELHRIQVEKIRARERELVERRAMLVRKCQEKITA
jgi:hypothetical protein